MKVRISAQREFAVEKLGPIVFSDDPLVAEPESTALANLLSEPLVVYQGTEQVEIDPKKEPAEFLKALPQVVSGSYLGLGNWKNECGRMDPHELTPVVPLMTSYARPASQDLALTPAFTDGELPLD